MCHARERLLADGAGKVEDGGGDVRAEWVAKVRRQALDRALTCDECLNSEADERHHGQASVFDCGSTPSCQYQIGMASVDDQQIRDSCSCKAAPMDSVGNLRHESAMPK